MKHKEIIIAISAFSSVLFAANPEQLQLKLKRLQDETRQLQTQLSRLQKQVVVKKVVKPKPKPKPKPAPRAALHKKKIAPPRNKPKPFVACKKEVKTFHTSVLSVHTVNAGNDPNQHSVTRRYPTALIADGRVISYIAGTPVVTSPYLGARPAFDGSDYIVNISSINRDIRLMEQRRRLYRAYENIGYPKPNMPIIAVSGKAEPIGIVNRPYMGRTAGDLNLGSSELDVAAALNDKVEAFISIAYDETPPPTGPRVTNSAFNLNMGFVNIGNLDQSPFYFTAGQMYAPFGRYSSSMVSSTLTQRLARTKSRPFILGYKSQADAGLYAAIYGFKSDTDLGHSGIGGVNLGYTVRGANFAGDLGVGYISSLTDSMGMQITASTPFTTFGGFASATNGSELIHKVPGIDIHGNISFDRYSLTAEWVSVTQAFHARDLSFNGKGARPQAAQFEGGLTFMAFEKPASLALSYQWSKETLALNLPKHRISGVFSISIWRDTIESLEYRHDVDFSRNQFANGVAPPGLANMDTIGTGFSANALIAKIGVFF